ncbi:MAG: molybdopterin-dependent oxidoreductase, partial [Chloroflexia bacterium]
VLHLLLPRTGSALFAIGDDGDIEFDNSRRQALRVLGGFIIALAGGSIFAGAGTILAQGGLQSPVNRDDPNSGTTSELVVEEPATSTPKPTNTSTPRPTATRTHTPTPTQAQTPIPQPTDQPTFTPTETFTPEPPSPTPTETFTPVPTDTPLPTSTPVPAINVAEITPLNSFYHVSKNFFDPEPDITAWKLDVKGHVAAPYSLTYAQLVALPSVEVVVGMMCISNPIGGDLIGNTRWRGVRLADLLAKAKPRKGVVDLILTAADGYQDSITYEKALDTDVILVWEMDGAKLNFAHGSPARLLVPGIYGMKHVKWLTSIDLVDYNFKGFWQSPDQGWSEPAPVNTMSKIAYPSSATALSLGAPHNISGIAFAGDRSISRVEISADNGDTWADAYIKPKLSETSWIVWGYTWTPPAKGKFTLRVRATDGQGNLQTSKRTDPYPNGSTGYHGVTYTVK